jgi:hypothetical protein
MRNRRAPAKRDRLWRRYWAIVDEHATGLSMPILWHLALGGDRAAMVMLASSFPFTGKLSDPFSEAGLCYRAWRAGYALGAQHLAMDAFNRGDMTGYRRWLCRAGQAGDVDAGREYTRFETRLPHSAARRVGRCRPLRACDFA